MIIEYKCAECGLRVRKQRNLTLPGKFCSRECKAAFQKRAKPVSEEWLREQYITRKLDTTKIGVMVNRDPKSVWNWLKDFGIATRKRGTTRNAAGHVSIWRGKKLPLKTRRKISASHKKRGSCPAIVNGVHWMKGKPKTSHPNWKGGITAERQSLYASPEWKLAVKIVWRRDNATCQRCGKKQNQHRETAFDVHHVSGFANKSLRAKSSNLILLCEPCHYWVHGKNNKNRKFIK